MPFWPSHNALASGPRYFEWQRDKTRYVTSRWCRLSQRSQQVGCKWRYLYSDYNLFGAKLTSLTSTGLCNSTWEKVLFRLFLLKNNFHHRCHRKVATRHTLPKIQTSLSLRKFSMLNRGESCPPDPAVHLHRLYFLIWPEESQMAGSKALAWRGIGGQFSVAVYRTIVLHRGRRERWACQVTCLPSQPSPPPLQPAPSLPPYPWPKRRGRAVCETRRWQVVLGSGCRRCVQNQMSAASAGMLARPLSCPLTLDAALHRCISVWRCLPAPRKTNTITTAHGAGHQRSRALVNKPLAANLVLGWFFRNSGPGADGVESGTNDHVHGQISGFCTGTGHRSRHNFM